MLRASATAQYRRQSMVLCCSASAKPSSSGARCMCLAMYAASEVVWYVACRMCVTVSAARCTICNCGGAGVMMNGVAADGSIIDNRIANNALCGVLVTNASDGAGCIHVASMCFDVTRGFDVASM